MINGLFRKKSKQGRLRIYFKKKTLKFLTLSKQSFTLEDSVELCYTPRKFHRHKRRLMEIQHEFFLINPRNSTSFSNDPWNLHIFFNIPENFSYTCNIYFFYIYIFIIYYNIICIYIFAFNSFNCLLCSFLSIRDQL